MIEAVLGNCRFQPEGLKHTSPGHRLGIQRLIFIKESPVRATQKNVSPLQGSDPILYFQPWAVPRAEIWQPFRLPSVDDRLTGIQMEGKDL